MQSDSDCPDRVLNGTLFEHDYAVCQIPNNRPGNYFTPPTQILQMRNMISGPLLTYTLLYGDRRNSYTCNNLNTFGTAQNTPGCTEQVPSVGLATQKGGNIVCFHSVLFECPDRIAGRLASMTPYGRFLQCFKILSRGSGISTA